MIVCTAVDEQERYVSHKGGTPIEGVGEQDPEKAIG
jgi:hypothetical protein